MNMIDSPTHCMSECNQLLSTFKAPYRKLHIGALWVSLIDNLSTKIHLFEYDCNWSTTFVLRVGNLEIQSIACSISVTNMWSYSISILLLVLSQPGSVTLDYQGLMKFLRFAEYFELRGLPSISLISSTFICFKEMLGRKLLDCLWSFLDRLL